MRIGIFLGNISGPGSGSWSRLESLLDALQCVGNDVDVIVYGQPDLICELDHRPGITIRSLPHRNRRSWWMVSLFGASRIARRDGLDVVQFETRPLLRRLPVPVIFSIHDLREFHDELPTDSRRIGNLARRWLIRRSARVATGILTLTQWSKSDIAHWLGVDETKVIDIPFSVDPHRVVAPSPKSSASPQRYVLALGHLEPRKNVSVLIRAAACAKWPADVELVVAGEDHGSEHALQALARSLNAPVRFVGKVSASHKQELLEGAAVVLVPSLLEGFGIVVTEAVMSGTPVLVSDRSALPEVVGVADAVISATDERAWALHTARLVEDGSYRCDLLRREIGGSTRRTLVGGLGFCVLGR